MYRRQDGSKGFSYMRMLNNTLPVMRFDSAIDPGYISLPQRDLVYANQMVQRNPYGLSEFALQASAILDNDSAARKTYQKLQKTGVITQDGTIDTTRIDGNFTHQLATIPATRQKQIIDLLFWWKEESQRLRKLNGEREELEGLVAGAGDAQQRDMYARLLERVRGKLGAKPSERVESVERDEDEMMVSFRRGTLGRQTQQNGAAESLPGYSA